MKHLAFILFVLAGCKTQPAVTTPPPTIEAGPPTCDGAYEHYIDMGCPPEEDAYGGWVQEVCKAYPSEVVACIAEKDTCAAARGCEEIQ